MIKREDVIFDPTDPRVENLIGEYVIFGDTFKMMQNKDCIEVLRQVVEYVSFPFMNDKGIYTLIAPIPEPLYRPFKSADEFEPYRDKWVIIKGGHAKIITYDNYGCACSTGAMVSYKTAFEQSTFEDGTPFGIKE